MSFFDVTNYLHHVFFCLKPVSCCLYNIELTQRDEGNTKRNGEHLLERVIKNIEGGQIIKQRRETFEQLVVSLGRGPPGPIEVNSDWEMGGGVTQLEL